MPRVSVVALSLCNRTLLRFWHFGSILGSHSLLIDLSSRSLRKLLISHEDVLHFWYLELGQRGCCMLVDLLRSDSLARLREYGAADNLTQSRIWKTKHRALSDFRIQVDSG